MTLTLNLPPELQEELSAEAAQFSLPLSEYILRVLATGRTTETRPKTGAELLKYWEKESLIGSRTNIADSQKHARKIRGAAERRVRS